ncbi:hypothetical protein QFC21_007207 [Naganishia friedmannii]|uniref:Uncharacterized protein n=1 Tax=Naganishia friedmannii TaxID=89922 RepID=A0ACC2UYQ5_9TREE|nr:hypothetical protein QFC21_007207 [Naganishia friedmannii]
MPDYTLFYHSGSASMIPHWLLIELSQRHGITFDTHSVDFSAKAQKSEAYLKINPKGVVPALVIHNDNGTSASYTESAAIALLLAARHPEANLAPLDVRSPQYAKYIETMVYLANTVLPSMRDWFYARADSQSSSEPTIATIKQMARTRIRAAWDLLDTQLQDQPYLVENVVRGEHQPTAADFLLVVLARWSRNFEEHAVKWKNLDALIRRMTSRDSWVVLKAQEEFDDADWPR